MANKQWGSSYISMHPRSTGSTAMIYFPEKYTISGTWGDFPTYSNPIANEFKYYNEHYEQVQPKKVELTEVQVAKLISSEFDEQGMNNLYNSVKFIASSQCLNITSIIQWEQTYGTSTYYFSEPMQFMVENLMLGGANMTVEAMTMITGYNSTVAAQVNGGDFF